MSGGGNAHLLAIAARDAAQEWGFRALFERSGQYVALLVEIGHARAGLPDRERETAALRRMLVALRLDVDVIADVQALARRRILRVFISRGLIDKSDGEEMGGWEHGGGFSVDASACVAGEDRAGLERLLRYCARPPFSLEHSNESPSNPANGAGNRAYAD